ncbi:MAG: CPBP family intramembrane metalloprotease [Clostridiales bacterium]|nr:CPBP family intramembrane metalloprotease [Clostridiales bacterium]
MTFKNFLKSCVKALLYFAVYFGWQMITVNIASAAASIYVASTLDTAEMELTYQALQKLLIERTYDIVMQYSLHLTLLSGALTLLTYMIVIKARKKKLCREFGLTKLPLSQIPILFALGAALNVFVSMAMSLIPFPAEWVESYVESADMLTNSGVLMMVLTTVIAAPIVEEITFRGMFYSRLKQGMPMFAAMLISSWVFGMMHGEIIWVIYASLLGFLLVWVSEKYRSLTASIIVHFAFNLFGSLTDLLGEISDITFFTLLISSALVSVALMIYIFRNSKNRIEFTLKNSGEKSEV